MEVRYATEAEEQVRVKEEECAHEIRKREVRVREMEKRAEMLKINGEERVNLAIDKKDKEISKLMEELSKVKMENDIYVHKLENKMSELQSELTVKESNLETFKV